MKTRLEHEDFKTRPLEIEFGRLFRDPVIYQAGRPATKEDSQYVRYLVIDDSERQCVVEVDTNYFDPAPTLVIHGQRIATARALRWYQWVWMLVPVLGLFTGGFVGLVCAMGALYLNARVFRSTLDPTLQYVVTGAVSVSAIALGFILSMMFFLVYREVIGQ